MKRLKLIGLLAIACSAVLVLGACGKSQSQSNTTSSSSKQVQSSRSSQGKASSSDKVVNSSSAPSQAPSNAATSSSEVSQSSETAPSTEPSSSPEAPAPTTPTTGGIDVNAIANGDFSSVAGTWQDDLGNQLTFTADGTTVLTRADGRVVDNNTLYGGEIINGYYFTQLGFYSAGSSAPLIFIPVGAKMPMTGNDCIKEQVHMGSDAAYNLMHPYYRVQ